MADRRQYRLSVVPVNYSLTAGTNIPAPPHSPPESPITATSSPSPNYVRPPTPFGGPLSSHPACPEEFGGIVLPPTPEADKENIPHREHNTSRPGTGTGTGKRSRQPSIFKLPTSPASASPPPSLEHQRRPSAVRKLLSLSSLRSSFNTSRTSISLPLALGQHNSNETSPDSEGFKRPYTPSIFSISPSFNGSQQSAVQHNQPRPVLHHRKSGSWFKRKSSMLLGGNDSNAYLGAVHEDSRPDTRDSKRIKVLRPAPSIPELRPLGDNQMGSGEIGWDEQQFK